MTVTILTSFEKSNNPYDSNDFTSVVMFMHWTSQFKDFNLDSSCFAKASLPKPSAINVSRWYCGVFVCELGQTESDRPMKGSLQ